MGSEMIFKMSICHELLPTYSAFMRLLSIVDSEMSFQIATFSEALRTILMVTYIGFLTSLKVTRENT